MDTDGGGGSGGRQADGKLLRGAADGAGGRGGGFELPEQACARGSDGEGVGNAHNAERTRAGDEGKTSGRLAAEGFRTGKVRYKAGFAGEEGAGRGGIGGDLDGVRA